MPLRISYSRAQYHIHRLTRDPVKCKAIVFVRPKADTRPGQSERETVYVLAFDHDWQRVLEVESVIDPADRNTSPSDTGGTMVERQQDQAIERQEGQGQQA